MKTALSATIGLLEHDPKKNRAEGRPEHSPNPGTGWNLLVTSEEDKWGGISVIDRDGMELQIILPFLSEKKPCIYFKEEVDGVRITGNGYEKGSRRDPDEERPEAQRGFLAGKTVLLEKGMTGEALLFLAYDGIQKVQGIYNNSLIRPCTLSQLKKIKNYLSAKATIVDEFLAAAAPPVRCPRRRNRNRNRPGIGLGTQE